MTISSPSGNSFIGLNLYADDIIMHTQSLKDDSVQSLHTFEGKRTRLTLTVLPTAYGNPGFNLCILYINGRKTGSLLMKIMIISLNRELLLLGRIMPMWMFMVYASMHQD